MRTPEAVAAMLVAGTLDRRLWPELDQEEFVAEVRRRLGQVSLDLVAADGHWIARPSAALHEEGFHPFFRLNRLERAVVAAAYLYLRYLPSQPGYEGHGQEASVRIEDLIRPFPHSRGYMEKQVLGHLRHMRFLMREGDRILPGPYLAGLDEIAVNERAKPLLERFLIRRHLRKEAEELKRHATD